MSLVLQLLALVVVAVLVAYVWDDLFDTIDQARGGELLEFPTAAGWTEHDVAMTLAEISSL
jgi:hypothetical protein